MIPGLSYFPYVLRDGPLEKLWGVEVGNFRAAVIFFRYQIPCMIFFWPWHEYFLGLIGVHDFFFHLTVPCANIFFVVCRPHPSPPPISFLMVRPLQGLAIETCYSEEFVQHHSSHRSATLTNPTEPKLLFFSISFSIKP